MVSSKKRTKKDARYYVHALLDLRGVRREKLGGYRWHWLAMINARLLLLSHPYGQAVITRTNVSPEVTC